MSGAKNIEEKEFYIALCVKEKYSKRELERQLQSAYYQRYMLSTQRLAPADVLHNENARFLDSYVLEFLDLPDKHSESDLKHAIVQNLKDFVLEIMNFYLEALDRDHKKQDENPSIGVILCASKEEDVVEYAMSRSLSPTMVAEYELKLIDKALLEQKLREFKRLLLNNEPDGDI
jgi:hypothetical protein